MAIQEPFVLPHVFELYIPTKCRCQQPIPTELREAVFSEAQQLMALWFGGGTVVQQMPAQGIWHGDTGDLVHEGVDIIFSNASHERYEQHLRTFQDYAVDLANRLAQEAVACRIDGKLYLFDSTQSGCLHDPDYVSPVAPRRRRNERLSQLMVIRGALRRLHDEQSARDLMTHVLHYPTSTARYSLVSWPASARELLVQQESVPILAEHDGFRILLITLAGERVLVSPQRQIIERVFHDTPTFTGLLLFTNPTGSEWHLVNVKRESTAPTRLVARRLRITPASIQHTPVKQLAQVDLQSIGLTTKAAHIQAAYDKAFEAQVVTAEFFKEYRRIFEHVRDGVIGFAPTEHEARHLFTQRLFNRLMFVAFIQKKGWLRYHDSTEYLLALWGNYFASAMPGTSFYRDRLKPLFFAGLNSPREARAADLAARIGDVPYLNGGLFAQDAFDQRADVDVADTGIEEVLTGLFVRYNFTVTESTELDQDVAIDPEMLGHVFEELVVGRHESGSYYTPKPIVTFMCRQALKQHIQTKVPREADSAITAFIDTHDPMQLRFPEQVLDALRTIRVCDPACGSGAYLLGMLHELMELRGCLFTVRTLDPITAYQRKLDIIEQNLFGVDIDPLAVDIARLRLWLSLAIEFDGDTPLPLPNLDFKIEQGDSLTAPMSQGMLHDAPTREFAEAKARFIAASDPAVKASLTSQIAALREELAEWRTAQNTSGFDWQIEYAEVFAEGGFDVILANPPYVHAGAFAIPAKILKSTYTDRHCGTADLYVYFYYRALDLLKSHGTLVFISSNSWLQAQYATTLRAHLRTSAQVELLVDLGDNRVFPGAPDAYTAIVVIRKATPLPQQTAKVATFTRGEAFLPFESTVPGRIFPVSIYDQADTGWMLVPATTRKLYQKLIQSSRPLHEVVEERLYRGILTGLNEAFIIDERTHDTLVDKDPSCVTLLKHLLQGEDLRAWHQEDAGRWLICIPTGWTKQTFGPGLTESKAWSLFSKQHPSLAKYLKPFAEKGRKRGDKGEYWWELRHCDFYDDLAQPKIFWPDIAKSPRFSWDDTGYYMNDKGFTVITGDLALLAVLQSRVIWFVISLLCTPLGERKGLMRYQQKPQFLGQLPIPPINASDRIILEQLAMHLIALARERYANLATTNRYLVEQLGKPLRNAIESWWDLDVKQFLAELEKQQRQPLSDEKDVRWQQWHDVNITKHHQLTGEITCLEKELNSRIYHLFGLSYDEILIIEARTKYMYGQV